jgi:hypothetical protein
MDYNCPPRMSDGRHFTDYRPRCAVTYEMQPNPMSAYNYRMYMTENAEQIMEMKRDTATRNNTYDSCVKDLASETHVEKCDSRSCTFDASNPRGLGLGRDYATAS